MSEQATIDKAISMVVNTGKVIFGAKKAIKNVKNGKGKALIIASNCLPEIVEELTFRSEKAKIPIIKYSKNSWDLGATCGRPHKISVITIMKKGDSKILKLTK